MNATNILGLDKFGSVSTQYNKGLGAQSYVSGSTLSATVLSSANGRTKFIAGGDFVFEADTKGMVLNKGDVLDFEVTGRDKNTLSLKLAGALGEQSGMGQMSPVDVLDLFKMSNVVNEEDIFEIKSVWAPDEEERNTAAALAIIKNKLQHLNGNISVAVINELLANGIALQKLSIDMVDSAIAEISQSAGLLSVDEIEGIVDKYYADFANALADDEKGGAVASLLNNKLPVNQQNMDFIDKGLKVYEQVQNLEDSAIAKIIGEGRELTLKDLFYAKYSTAQSNGEAVVWEGMDNEIYAHFKKEGIAPTGENFNNAVFLIENDLPVTAKNLDQVLFLKDFSKSISRQEFIDQAVKAIKQGNNPLDTELTTTGAPFPADAPDYGYVQSLSGTDIAIAENQGIPLTLENLQYISENRGSYPAFAQEQSSFSARLNLLEIQLKLTVEASYQLRDKGIEIDTLPLKEAVESLRALENSKYEAALKTAGAEPTPDHVNRMNTLYTGLAFAKPFGMEAAGDIVERIYPFTIEGAVKSAYGRLEEMYEPHATAPLSKYGDSFSKVYPKMGEFLESIGVNPTEKNIRAAAILSRNKIDITEENLVQVKIVDQKLSQIQDTLHPAIAAQMVKEGVDIMDMHVDDVIDYIEGFENQYGNGLRDKIPAYIHEMDQHKALSAGERESMLAVYRLLHQIDKYGGASLGANIKSGAEPTLKNLFDASKYYSRTGGIRTFAAYDIDDSAGDRIDKAPSEPSIRELLERTLQKENDKNKATLEALNTSSSKQVNENLYAQLMAKALGHSLNPEIFEKLLQDHPDFLDRPIDELLALIPDDGEGFDAFQAEQYFRQIQESLSLVPPETVAFMEELEIPVTIENMLPARNLLHSMRFPYADAGRIIGGTDDETYCPDEDGIDPFTEEITQALEDKAFAEPQRDLLREINLIQNGIKVQSFMTAKNHSYKLPVKINGKLGCLNMYIPGGQLPDGDAFSMALFLDTGHGEFSGIIKSSADMADMYIKAGGDLDALIDANRQLLQDMLKDAGFQQVSINMAEMPQEYNLAAANRQLSQKQLKDRMFLLAKTVTNFLGEVQKAAAEPIQ